MNKGYIGNNMELGIKDKRIGLKCNVVIEVFDADTNKLIEEHFEKNQITTAGLGQMLSLISGKDTAFVRYCAVGDDNTAVSRAHTGLQGNVLKRKEYTEAYVTNVSVNNYKCQIKTFFGRNDGNGTWKEVGLFSGDNNTSMISRIVLGTALTKDDTKTCVVTWQHNLSEV